MTSKKPQSWRHHYLPQFYLKGWTTNDRLWLGTQPRPGKIAWDHVPTKSAGFERHLYTSSDILPGDRTTDLLETSVFQKLDQDASLVYQKLVAGDFELEARERRDWSRFTRSLIERSPRTLRINTAHALRLYHQTWADIRRTAQSTRSRRRLTAAKNSAPQQLIAKRLALAGMTQSLGDEHATQILSDLSWDYFETQDPVLITGDYSVVVNYGLEILDHMHVLTLALTPRLLLVMRKPDLALSGTASDHLATLHNLVVAQRSSLIVANDKLSDVHLQGMRAAAQAYVDAAHENLMALVTTHPNDYSMMVRRS